MTIMMNQIDCEDNRSCDPKGIEELAENIDAVGLLNPILLGKNGDRYKVIAGRRRYRAMAYRKVAELTDREYAIVDPDDSELIAFSENFHRENMTLAEEVEQLGKLRTGKTTIEQLAALVGKTPRWVALRLNLTQLSGKWTEVLKKQAEYPQWTPARLEEIARQPEKVQKSLEYLTDGHDPSKLKDELKRKFNRNLAKAKFGKTACVSCPKRSVHDLLLWTDDEDLCFDADCFDKKCTAFILAEVEKLKKCKADIALLQDGYISYGTPLYKLNHQALYCSSGKIKEKGEPNAFLICGEKAGTYVHFEPASHRKDDFERSKFSYVNPKKSGKDAEAKPPKTLADREKELLAKRNKLAVEKLIGHLDSTVGFPPPESRTILNLIITEGYASDYKFRRNSLDKAHKKLNQEYKTEAALLESCWKELQSCLATRLRQDISGTLDHISADDAMTVCKLLNIDWKQVYFMPACVAIPEPKSLITARAEAEKEKATAPKGKISKNKTSKKKESDNA